MDSHFFRAEMHRYIDEQYDVFLDYQELVRKILDEFHRVCNVRHVPYWVGYGSLIGMVRDKGSIPWDYDIDVFVPYSSMKALISALEEELGRDYYYVYTNKMKNYPTSCLRVCMKGYTYMAIHVDVFFLIGCPDNDTQLSKFRKRIAWLYHAREAKYINHHLCPKKRQSLPRRILTTLRYPISGDSLEKAEKKLCSRYSFENSKRVTVFYPNSKAYTRESFDSTIVLNLDGREYNIPIGFDAFLTQVYGNYREYMPISQRFDEFYKMGRIIEERQSVYEKYLKDEVEKRSES